MSQRVTESDLYQLVRLINTALGLVPHIDSEKDESYSLDFANGGVRLVRNGGSVDVSPRGTKREVEEWMRAFHAGIIAGKADRDRTNARRQQLAEEQHDVTERLKGSYQYGVRISNATGNGTRIDIHPTKAIAENAARDWVISPLRTGPRWAETVRRRGWGAAWETLDRWTTPESAQ